MICLVCKSNPMYMLNQTNTASRILQNQYPMIKAIETATSGFIRQRFQSHLCFNVDVSDVTLNQTPPVAETACAFRSFVHQVLHLHLLRFNQLNSTNLNTHERLVQQISIISSELLYVQLKFYKCGSCSSSLVWMNCCLVCLLYTSPSPRDQA